MDILIQAKQTEDIGLIIIMAAFIGGLIWETYKGKRK